MSAQLTRIFHAYDESLNKAHSNSYELSIQMSLDGFSFTIFNTLNSKFLSLESAELNYLENPEEFSHTFREYAGDHPWLGEAFAKTAIFMEAPKSTLVPGPLFRDEDKEPLARFNFEVTDGMDVFHDHLNSVDAYLLYLVPKALRELVDGLFPGHSLKCHASLLIEELLILNKNLPAVKRMFVNVRHAQLDIVITEGKQLLFYNSFPYHSKQDFIYFIIFVIEQLNLNPEELELKLSGRIDRKSTLFDMAWKYVRNIEFQELTGAYRYSYLFNDIPPHYYFTLLHAGLCES